MRRADQRIVFLSEVLNCQEEGMKFWLDSLYILSKGVRSKEDCVYFYILFLSDLLFPVFIPTDVFYIFAFNHVCFWCFQ